MVRGGRRWPGITPHGGRPLRRPCLRSALPDRGSARRAGGGGPPRVSQALPSRSADSAPRERKAAPPPAMPRSAAEPRPFPPGHSPSITTAGAPPWARLRVTWSARREPPARHLGPRCARPPVLSPEGILQGSGVALGPLPAPRRHSQRPSRLVGSQRKSHRRQRRERIARVLPQSCHLHSLLS